MTAILVKLLTSSASLLILWLARKWHRRAKPDAVSMQWLIRNGYDKRGY